MVEADDDQGGTLISQERYDLIGKRIKALRQFHGWDQIDFSTVSGISPRTIKDLEGGKKVSIETIKSACSAVNIDYKMVVATHPASHQTVDSFIKSVIAEYYVDKEINSNIIEDPLIDYILELDDGCIKYLKSNNMYDGNLKHYFISGLAQYMSFILEGSYLTFQRHKLDEGQSLFLMIMFFTQYVVHKAEDFPDKKGLRDTMKTFIDQAWASRGVD